MIAGFNPNKRGEYLGISTSIMSLALVIGPLITTATFNWNPHIPFVIASVIVMAGYFLLKESKISHMYHK
jgi:MFS family permease